MAGEPTTTLIGNLTGDPELRFTPSGQAVVNFTIAVTPRTKDGDNGWKDGDTQFWRCSAWRDVAENIAESFTRGTRVVAEVRIKPREYEKDGVRRLSLEAEVEEIGASVRYSTVKVTKADRQGGGGGRSAPTGGWSSAPAPQQQGYADPWASPAPDQFGHQPTF